METHPKSVSATSVKNRFGDYLGEVMHAKRPLLIERHGKPVAVLVSFDQWVSQKKYRKRGGRPPSRWTVAAQRLIRQLKKDRTKVRSSKTSVELLHEIREEEGLT